MENLALLWKSFTGSYVAVMFWPLTDHPGPQHSTTVYMQVNDPLQQKKGSLSIHKTQVKGTLRLAGSSLHSLHKQWMKTVFFVI